MRDYQGLKKLQEKKKRLSLIFTLIFFFVIFVVELVYQSFKYYNYYKEEYDDLNMRLETFINSPILEWKFTENSILQYKKIFWKSNVLIIDTNTHRILFSSVNDYFFNNELIFQMNYYKDEWLVTELIVDGESYIVLKNSFITKLDNLTIFVFDRSDYSSFDFFFNLSQFLIILTWFSVILYYLGYLFVTYNLKPVEKNIMDMEDFIHNAWHELKTPIAVISTNLQLAKETKKYKWAIDDSLLELNKINDLIISLIKLTKINKNAEVESFNVVEIINEIIDDYSLKIKEKKLNITVNTRNWFKVTANKEYFIILFSNILSNAIKYTDKKWNIKIEISNHTIKVEDDWIWISSSDIDKVFERFFQSKDVAWWEWFGIWLSLVKKIADIYDWTIKVDSKKWVWTTFIINF